MIKHQRLPQLIKVYYDKKEDIPSYIFEQLINLRNKSNLFYQNFLVKARCSTNTMLCDYHSFFNNEGDRIFTLETGKSENRKVIGCLNVWVDETASKPCTYISNIWIEPEYRQLGLGSELVRFMYSNRQGNEFHISVYEDNEPAKKFWQSVGFINKLSSNYVLNWDD